MSASQQGISQHSLDLITAVKDHLTRLQNDNPEEAHLFRYRLAELLRDGDRGQPAGVLFDPVRAQLFTLRHQEEERARLAKQLREGPGQLLANAAMELAACVPLLDTDTDLVRQGLQSLEKELRMGLGRLRYILLGLEPPRLMKELGLFESIRTYAERLAEEYGVKIELQFPEIVPQLPSTVEIGVYRIIQEALSNAVEHGQAQTIILTAKQEDDDWRFVVQDDGMGFEPTQIAHARGLLNMYEWARAFNGTLDIQSKPGYGTTVTLTIRGPEVS
ncbi:MAG: sensor histidine kinase [Anaerolineae bacterium]|nr:sensor histidine kinase [Anaerolineae bacterium]